MDIPLGIPNCPPGLEYLSALDQLLIKQKVNITGVFTSLEMNMKFTVKNALGQDVSEMNVIHIFFESLCKSLQYS